MLTTTRLLSLPVPAVRCVRVGGYLTVTRTTPVLLPWYRGGVTETLASQIRALAAKRDYDQLDADAQRAMRRELTKEFNTKLQVVISALKRRGTPGGHASISVEHRCPACMQVLRTQAAKKEVERIQVLKKK